MANLLSNPPTNQPAVTDGKSPMGTHIFTEIWKRWFIDLAKLVNDEAHEGLSTTVALAPLTGGGTAGSMTFANGKLTGYTAPT